MPTLKVTPLPADVHGKGNPKGLSCAQYKGTNSRYPVSDIQHTKNHRYDPAALVSEQTWACEVIDTWMASCEDDVATAVTKALSDAGVTNIDATLRGGRPVGAKAIRIMTLRHSQTYVHGSTLRPLPRHGR